MRFREGRGGHMHRYVRAPDGRWEMRTILAKASPAGLRLTCNTCGVSELFATVRERFLEWLEGHETCDAPGKVQKRAAK